MFPHLVKRGPFDRKGIFSPDTLRNRPPIPSRKSATNSIPLNDDTMISYINNNNLQTDCCDILTRYKKPIINLIESDDDVGKFQKEIMIKIINMKLRNSGKTRRRKRKKRTKQKKLRKRRKTNRKNY